jgi:hypothetical protein
MPNWSKVSCSAATWASMVRLDSLADRATGGQQIE